VPAPAIPDASSLLPILAIVFLATAVHASVGFGTALVAMPLLTLVIGLPTATPLVALLMLTNISVLLSTTHQHVELRAAWQLVLSAALGIPLGLYLVQLAPERGLKALLGAIVIAFSAYNLARPKLPELRSEAWVLPFGLAAGVLGGAYNTNGPPVVIYGALRQWPPERFRATLQGFFLPAAVLICAGHALAGLWSKRVFTLYALALPALAFGLLAGKWLGNRIPAERFGRLLYWLLIPLGTLLLL